MNPLASDLDHILAHTQGLWEELRGQRIFITGGTGFFGCWLLESFAWANDKLGLDATAVVLTRNKSAFEAKAPHLADHPSIQFHIGDLLSFEFPEGPFSNAIHAATAMDDIMARDPLRAFDLNVLGTRRVLEFARRAGVRRFLFTSSGAVYGRQPADMERIPEEFCGGPDPVDTHSTYGVTGEAKRAAESLCAVYYQQFGLETVIARCFAFVGPYLPLDGKFAIGNFIRDALQGGPILIKGDGTPCRSYLYAADLAVWLWTLLLRGKPGRAYNVGSQEKITIAETAQLIARCMTPQLNVNTDQKAVRVYSSQRYIPSTDRVFKELKLGVSVNVSEGIHQTLAWYQQRKQCFVSKIK